MVPRGKSWEVFFLRLHNKTLHCSNACETVTELWGDKERAGGLPWLDSDFRHITCLLTHLHISTCSSIESAAQRPADMTSISLELVDDRTCCLSPLDGDITQGILVYCHVLMY